MTSVSALISGVSGRCVEVGGQQNGQRAVERGSASRAARARAHLTLENTLTLTTDAARPVRSARRRSNVARASPTAGLNRTLTLKAADKRMLVTPRLRATTYALGGVARARASRDKASPRDRWQRLVEGW
jgi:hypothetical protein